MGPELNFEHFVGRRDELAAMNECFERAASGRTMLVAVSGEAGIGKSRLVREFGSTLEKKAAIGVGHCLEHLKIPFLPFGEIVRGLGLDLGFALAQGEKPATRGRAQSEERLRRLQNIAQALLSTSARPYVVVIEDAHWADAATLGLLEHLTMSAPRGRLMVILTVRSEAVERNAAFARTLSKLRGTGLVSVRLSSLHPAETTALLRTASPVQLPRPTLEKIKDVCEGNPLFAEELLRAAVDDNALPHPAYASIRATVIDRLYQLSESDQRVVVCASVIGRFFDPQLVATLAERPFGDAVAALRRARNLQLVREVSGSASSRMLAFRHNIFAEVVYQELLGVEARNLHARVAKYLESKTSAKQRVAEIAYHYSSAQNSEKALQYNIQAGDDAMRMTAFEDAAGFYETALCYVETGTLQHAELCEKRAHAWYAAGVAENTAAVFSEALNAYEALGDREKVGAMLLFLSRQAWNDAETPDGYRHALRAVEIFGESQPATRNYAMTMAASYATHLGQIDEAESIAGSLSAADPDIDARIIDTRAIIHARKGQIGRALALCAEAQRAAQRSGDPDVIVRVFSNAADLYGLCGRRKEATDLWHQAFRAAETGGYIGRMAYAALGYANSLIDCGQLTQAYDLFNTAMETGVKNASVAIQAATAGALLKALGGFAVPPFIDEEAALQLALRSQESVRIGQVGGALAFACIAENRYQDARGILHRATEALEVPVFAELLLLLAGIFGTDTTKRRASHILEDAHARYGDLAVLDLCYKAVDTFNSGGGAAESRLQSIAERWGKLNCVVLQMTTLIAAKDSGSLHEILTAIGARAFAERLDTSREKRVNGGILTKRELQVAHLLSNEASNKSIAEALGISERTVEHHVESILQRLGVRSRWLVTPSLVSQYE